MTTVTRFVAELEKLSPAAYGQDWLLTWDKTEDDLKQLEKECLANNAKFKSWECDANKMKLTQRGEALYMHCLPADISGVSCAQGEVSQDVFEKYHLATYREAGFKPFVIAAMIFLSRVREPVKMLERLPRGR